ncbi:hypothetical protein DFJ74DRAFT_773518 [Hyaloraphidium curvatum]|nr:hypothetical protein DFJ74DRAFT_773518 [Hyaloraphidium curvatum]
MKDIPELVLLLLLDSPFLRPSSAVSLLHASPALWRLSTAADAPDGSGRRPASGPPLPANDDDGDRLWRRMLVEHFPFWVYDGQCEGHVRCPAQHIPVSMDAFKSRHRLPSSPRLAFLRIVRGGISLVCQVINSETPLERMQSVCFGLVTFQPYVPPPEKSPGLEEAGPSSSAAGPLYTPSSSTNHRPPADPSAAPAAAPPSAPPWHEDDSWLANYDPAFIARSGYHPVKVALPASSRPSPPQNPRNKFELAPLHEPFTVVTAAVQFRRVPEEFILSGWDPRELWFREIWDRRAKFGATVDDGPRSDRGSHVTIPGTIEPTEADAPLPTPPASLQVPASGSSSAAPESNASQTPEPDPFIYEPGTPIEVQWFQPSLFLRRNDQLDFWHGRVLEHNPVTHAIVIDFPQYRLNNDIYRRVVADDRGMLREGVAGMCGGIREVRCVRERWKWAKNFVLLESGGGALPEGMAEWDVQGPDDDDDEIDEGGWLQAAMDGPMGALEMQAGAAAEAFVNLFNANQGGNDGEDQMMGFIEQLQAQIGAAVQQVQTQIGFAAQQAQAQLGIALQAQQQAPDPVAQAAAQGGAADPVEDEVEDQMQDSDDSD